MKRMAFALMSLLVALPALAKIDMVVLDVRGVKLQPGQVIDGSEKLTLADGQQVTLMMQDGKMVKLRGPFDRSPAPDTAPTANVQLALQSLMTQENQRERAGVIRGGPGAVIPPDPWLIDISTPGLRCLPRDSAIILWRPDAQGTLPLQIAPNDRSWKAQADWENGADRLSLPDSIPLLARTTYVVKLGTREVSVTLIALPASLTNDAMRAGYMMEAGCDAQAKALFAKMGVKVQ